MCAIYLPLKLLDAGASSPDVGQLVDLRRFAVYGRLRAIVCRQSTVARGLGTFLAGSGAIGSRSGAVGGCRGAIGRCHLTTACLAESLFLRS